MSRQENTQMPDKGQTQGQSPPQPLWQDNRPKVKLPTAMQQALKVAQEKKRQKKQ
jgi:hypothetical protein